MKYSIKPNVVTKINETSGTIQNADTINKVELSNSSDFTHSILLYPHQKISFAVQLYARLLDNTDLPVELRVVPFTVDGGGSGGSSGGTVNLDDGEHTVISDSDFNSMLDDLGI